MRTTLLAGLIVIIARRGPPHLIMLWWFLLFPIGASLMTWKGQHALRAVIALPCLQIIAAVGFAGICGCISDARRLKPKPWLPAALLLTLVAANAGVYFKYYFTGYPRASAQYFNYGFREGFSAMEENRAGFRAMIVTDTVPYVYAYLFFHVPPRPDPSPLKEQHR